MAMSKKDYVLIAGALNRMRQDVSADTTGALDAHERHLVVATIDQLGDDLGRKFAGRVRDVPARDVPRRRAQGRMTVMQIFDATTATPSAAYVKVTTPEGVAQVQPFIPFGNPDTGGLTAPTWAHLRGWLIRARREVEYEMRKNPPARCEGLYTRPDPSGEHDWMLVESGCERVWTGVEVTTADDDEGRAEGAGDTRVVADAAREDDVSDGEGYYLQCRNCMAEANADEVDFI